MKQFGQLALQTGLMLALAASVADGQEAPGIVQQPTNAYANLGQSASFTVSASGSPPLSYVWQANGRNVSNSVIALASASQPYGLRFDTAGNLFVADAGNSTVFKVDPHGVKTIVAGLGAPGFSGDGGAATNARLRAPTRVVCDAGGRIFIADTANNCIRRVDAAGVISTIAGVPGLDGGDSGDGGQAINAALNQPSGVALDGAGNLFIADQFNNRIRKITPDGVMTTVAGTGEAGYSGDNGAATNAQLNGPFSVSLDSNGAILVADFYNNSIRRIDPSGVITTVTGTTHLRGPNDAVSDANGGIYVAAASAGAVYDVTASGNATKLAGGVPVGCGFGSFRRTVLHGFRRAHGRQFRPEDSACWAHLPDTAGRRRLRSVRCHCFESLGQRHEQCGPFVAASRPATAPIHHLQQWLQWQPQS